MPPDLRLGSHHHDLAHRALVMATLDRQYGEAALLEAADGAAAAGADLLAVARSPGHGGLVGDEAELNAAVQAVEAVMARFHLPIAIETDQAEVLRAAAKAGAVVAVDPSGSADPVWLPAAVDVGLTVVVRAAVDADPLSAYSSATSAGLRPDEVVLAASLAQLGPLAGAGHPVLVTDSDDDPAVALALTALAVTRGARLVRTADVAATVNVVRMLERILSV